jgi:signal transduction histidine kinase/predicted RNA-binding protein with RPS1 domain/DNA-binding NarL/FixJ family response regulator
VRELSARYPLGTVVEAEVTIVKSFEAVVTLDDGTLGFVKNRELSWGQEPDSAEKKVQKGQRIKAMVLGIDQHKGRLKLSLRQAERDPWKDIEQRYKVGQRVRCKVSGLLKRIAFVELEPAVVGYIRLREVCQNPPERIDSVLWINDSIEAVVTGFHPRRRRVSLSIRKLLMKLESLATEEQYERKYLQDSGYSGAPLIDFISPKDRLALLNVIKSRQDATKHLAPPQNSPNSISSRLVDILVADDDPSFRVSLKSLLETLGHRVQTVAKGEDAVELCCHTRFDLVLMDQKFRNGKIDGLQATRSITSSSNPSMVLMMTGLVTASTERDLTARVKKAGAVGILRKPVPLRLLVDRMSLIAAGKDCWDEVSLTNDPELSSDFVTPITSLPRHVSFHQSVSQELAKLLRHTQASACTLFHMDRPTGEVRAVVHAGAPFTAYDKGKYQLQATPIQEVIKQRMEVFEEDISHNPERFKYLNLIEYTSCIGLPVEMVSPTSYCLFLFHREKNHFTRDHLTLARISASHIGSIIDRDEIEHMVRKVQPLVFAGQVGFILVHELNNRLGSVVNCTSSLSIAHETIENDVSAAMDAKLREGIRTNTLTLKNNAQEMAQIASLYLGLTSIGNRELVRLNDTVERALSVLKLVAETNNVEIRMELDPNVPPTIAVGSWLEQAFVNVALNAIQHINMSKAKGELVVETRFATEAESLSLRVLFSDNGPGIHAQHLDHIFDLGFSTRTEGTGLGLFATRALIEALGGKVTVLSSVIFVGTTLMVELPLIVPSVEDPHDR